jgi:TonB family protein
MTTTNVRAGCAFAGSIVLHAVLILVVIRTLKVERIQPPQPDLINVSLMPSDGRADALRSNADKTFLPLRNHTAENKVRRHLAGRPNALPPPRSRHQSPITMRWVRSPQLEASESHGTPALRIRPEPLGQGSEDESNSNAVVPADQVAFAPQPLQQVVPDYPNAARKQGIEGRVVLRAVIDRRGRVEDSIQVIESIPVLDHAAMDALRQWTFKPACDRFGRTLRVKIEIPILFILR